MDEILTIDEIQSRYAPEWVLIGEPQTDEDSQRPRRVACCFTARIAR